MKIVQPIFTDPIAFAEIAPFMLSNTFASPMSCPGDLVCEWFVSKYIRTKVQTEEALIRISEAIEISHSAYEHTMKIRAIDVLFKSPFLEEVADELRSKSDLGQQPRVLVHILALLQPQTAAAA